MRRAGSEPPRLRDLDPERYLSDPQIKQRYVTTMFDVIAPRYDRFTRWFSYGRDRSWKREVLRRVQSLVPSSSIILDLACGTGDLAFGMAALLDGARVIGVDRSTRMLNLAASRRSPAVAMVHLCLGDMMTLPVPDTSVDLVTIGYGLRNTPDLMGALGEVARVLKRGGFLISLDFYQPERVVWSRLFRGYLSIAGALYGWLWHREPAAYGYIARSVRHYVTIRTFSRNLSAQGFVVDNVSPKLLGGIGIHVAQKQ
jgi:demethylmenaquinone methyltransferase/2-methoxy-6-polyprenyl-1,4-benzoquinol methylase